GGVVAALARIEPSLASDALVDLLGRALALAGPDELSPPELARGHRARGRALQLRGRIDDARIVLERALTLAGDGREIAADLWADLGVLYHQLRRMEPARTCYETALAISEGLGDDAGRARCLGNLGAVHHDLRRYDEALDHYQRGLAACRVAGKDGREGTLLPNGGLVLQERGPFAAAR